MSAKPRLFHVSDVSGIQNFEPRPDKNNQMRVWAIGEPRLHNYLTPRDCPRVTFFADTNTSAKDRESLGDARAVIAIESAWFERCVKAALYLYEFDPEPFSCVDKTACYYTASRSVRPLSETRVHNPIKRLLESKVELRILPSLWHLHDEIIKSSLGFSIIRMRNAAPRINKTT